MHEAAVTALYAVSAFGAVYPYAYAVGSAESIALLRGKEDADLVAARTAFHEVARGNDRLRWVAAATDPTRTVAHRARVADLLVLGQIDSADPPQRYLPPGFVESVLIESGRPALVIPYTGAPKVIGKVAVVAWKNTAESARALSAAMPILRRCERVHVARWGEADESEGDAPLEIERYLGLHGIAVTMDRRDAAPDSVGDALLSLAADTSADLLVMGCYGHSRARELVLGGATRAILKSMTVPVLMAH